MHCTPVRFGRHIRCARRASFLSVAAVLASGCYGMRRQAPLPLPMRLVSPTPFALEFTGSDGVSPVACLARRVDLDVSAMTRDTLHFASARILSQPVDQPTCSLSGPGQVVLAQYPQLRAERGELHSGRTWLAILAILPLAITTVWLVGWATYGGT